MKKFFNILRWSWVLWISGFKINLLVALISHLVTCWSGDWLVTCHSHSLGPVQRNGKVWIQISAAALCEAVILLLHEKRLYPALLYAIVDRKGKIKFYNLKKRKKFLRFWYKLWCIFPYKFPAAKIPPVTLETEYFETKKEIRADAKSKSIRNQ